MRKALKIPARLLFWELSPKRENLPLNSLHGAQSLCALQQLQDLQGALWGLLRVHQGFSACSCSTKWGHHNLSLCKLLLPSARTPPAQPWDQKDPHVLALLLIALKVKSTSGGDTGLKQKFSRYTVYWETNPECDERRVVRFELSALIETQKLFSSHHFNSGYR